MKSLIKSDFRRVLKDKLFFVSLIIGVVLALITPIIYSVIFKFAGEEAETLLPGLITAKAQFFQSFSLNNNLGLIGPVLLSIIICKDFSFGTVRNKIIAGKTRNEIFFSMFTVTAVSLIVIMLVHAFTSLGCSLIFFDYQATPFVLADVWYFIESLLFEIIILLFIAALMSWLCASMKNVGLVIVLYVAITFVLIIIGSITQVALSIFEIDPEANQALVKVLTFFNRINVCNSAYYIGIVESYSIKDVLYIVLPPVIGAAGFLGLGMLKFRRKDLK